MEILKLFNIYFFNYILLFFSPPPSFFGGRFDGRSDRDYDLIAVPICADIVVNHITMQ